MKSRRILLILFLIPGALSGQFLDGNISAYVDSLIEVIPSGNQVEYQDPTSAELLVWEQAIEIIDNNSCCVANELLNTIGYKIRQIHDTLVGGYFAVIEEQVPASKYWGTYVINLIPCRQGLILQAPHSSFDTNTGKQANFCFLQLNMRGLMLNSAHRCNSQVDSDCDGSTSVCGASSVPYKISDLAHNAKSIFQKTTELFDLKFDQSTFVQLHGFLKQVDDPYLIISNGTRMTPAKDSAVRLAEELKFIDDTLTAKIGHIDLDWNRLLGFTNVQARMLNQSIDPCEEVGDFSSGKFIHVEQERTRLRADSIGWGKMRDALAMTFPCLVTDVDDITELIEVEIFPNPSTGSFTVAAEGLKSIAVYSLDGSLVWSNHNIQTENQLVNIHDAIGAIGFVRVQTDKGLTVRKIIFTN